MKLTEAKLKQMILDEIKSNLEDKDEADELERTIEEVKILSDEIKALRQDRIDLHPRDANGVRQVGRNRTPEIREIDRQMAEKKSQIRKKAMDWGIPIDYASEPEKALELLKKRRRKKKK